MIINYIVLVSAAIHIKDYIMYHVFFGILMHQTQETIPFYLPPPTLILPFAPLVPNIRPCRLTTRCLRRRLRRCRRHHLHHRRPGLLHLGGFQIPVGVAGKTKGVLRLNPPETCKKRPFWIGLCLYLYIPLKVWKHFLHFEHKVMEVDGSDDVPFQLGDSLRSMIIFQGVSQGLRAP